MVTTSTDTDTRAIDSQIAEKEQQIESLHERLDTSEARCAAERDQILNRLTDGGNVGSTKLQAMELEAESLSAALAQAIERLSSLRKERDAAVESDAQRVLSAAVAASDQAADAFKRKFRAACTELRAEYDSARALRGVALQAEAHTATRTMYGHNCDAGWSGVPDEAMRHIVYWLDTLDKG